MSKHDKVPAKSRLVTLSSTPPRGNYTLIASSKVAVYGHHLFTLLTWIEPNAMRRAYTKDPQPNLRSAPGHSQTQMQWPASLP